MLNCIFRSEIIFLSHLRQLALYPITELSPSKGLQKVHKIYENRQKLKSYRIKRGNSSICIFLFTGFFVKGSNERLN